MQSSIRKVTAAVVMMSVAAGAYAQELKVLQQPTFWIVGQWTRIVIETPADCGELEVAFPEQLKLLDRWPHKPGDTRQRFYFRAAAPRREGEMIFRSGRYELKLPFRVLSWHEVLTEKFEREINANWATWTGTLKLPRLFPLDGKDEHKRGLSYLTHAQIDDHRKGFSRYLKGHAQRALPRAEDLHKLFYSLPESTIPRTVYLNNPVFRRQDKEPARGCPVCGPKVYEGRSPFYPWVLDRENRPMKIQCPECERWFPSNDFAKDDFTSGEFPDDGWNYFDDKARPYSFVGYYAMANYRGGERRTEEFSRMYLALGDKRLARAAAVLLFRVAEQYLNLALNTNQRNRYTRQALWAGKIIPQGTQPPSHSTWFAAGFYLDSVWSIGPDRFYAEAYERIWDYWAEEDPELIQFLQAQYHPEIKSMADVQRFIETGYFRTVAQGAIDRGYNGNGASEHMMAMRLARFLNTPRCVELVDWVFHNPLEGMRYTLANKFFVDGSGYESPGYNNAHYGGVFQMAGQLDQLVALRPEQYAKAGFPLLTEDPKFRYMFDHNISLTLISRTYANTGDDGDLPYTDPWPLNPGASWLGKRQWVYAFKRWPEEVNFARAIWDAKAGQPVKELTDPGLREKVTEIIKREGPYLELPSQVLDGAGHVILRSGKEDDQRDFWMRYGTAYGHGHHDVLTIGLEALKRTLLPEQGYNRGANHRTEWDMNWALHYCARIVGASSEPKDSWGCQGRHGASLHLFADGGWAKVATAARRFYDPAKPPRVLELTNDLLQQRTIALVDIDEKHSYALSIFRVGDGTDHYLSFHGPRGTAQSEGLDLTAQQGGTLAGPDVPYGIKWDSEWSKQNPHRMMFPFLYDVRRAEAKQPWRVTWDLEKYPDVHLRLHSPAAKGEEVALAKGKPPGGGKPYELQWVVRHAVGNEPLNTAFVEVIEAYEDDPFITAVRRIDAETTSKVAQPPVAFEVVCGDRVDTIIHSPDPAATVTTANGITMTGAFGVWSVQGGQVQRVLLVDGTRIASAGRELKPEAPTWAGVIKSTDFANMAIVVTPAHPTAEKLVGRYVRITNGLGNDTTHLVKAVKPATGGVELQLALDPRIGEGPIKKVHPDGIESAAMLKFSGLYYRGKTLCNEDGSAMYELSGMERSRVYIDPATHPKLNEQLLAGQFTDKDKSGVAGFVIYDYGPGDRVTAPSIVSWTADGPR